MSERGWSAARLGRESGLRESAIKNILRGKSRHPQINTLLGIGRGLKRSVSSMVDDEFDQPVKTNEEDVAQRLSRAIEEILSRVAEKGLTPAPQELTKAVMSLYEHYQECEELLGNRPAITIAGNVIRPRAWACHPKKAKGKGPAKKPKPRGSDTPR